MCVLPVQHSRVIILHHMPLGSPSQRHPGLCVNIMQPIMIFVTSQWLGTTLVIIHRHALDRAPILPLFLLPSCFVCSPPYLLF